MGTFIIVPRIVVAGSVLVLGLNGALGDEVHKSPSAAQLVQGVIDLERKFHDHDSLLIRTAGTWTQTPRHIAAKRAEIEKQLGTKDIPPARLLDLRPTWTESEELIFDAQRLRTRREVPQRSLDVRVWNGKLAKAHEIYPQSNQEHCAISADHQFFRSVPCLNWLQLGRHPFWWNAHGWFGFGSPDDYELMGQKEFRARDCYVLENRKRLVTLYVGVEDQRLHGLLRCVLESDFDPGEFMSRAAGRPIKPRDWDKWLSELPEAERRKVERKFTDEQFTARQPQFENYLDDYREVAPGFWVAWEHGYTVFEREAGESYAASRRDLKIIQFEVSPKLSDDVFEIEVDEGVKMIDWRYEPPLEYAFKKDMPDAEWKAILKKHEADRAAVAMLKELRAKQDKQIGQPATEFPKGQWFNSEPLTWKDVAGKVVILDFFAEWCGPCRGDLPRLAELHAKQKSSGITIIGVHVGSSREDAITAFLKEFDIKYPVCVDVEQGPKSTFGVFCESFHVRAIPHAVLVDDKGCVAAHGTVGEVLAKAQHLADDSEK